MIILGDEYWEKIKKIISQLITIIFSKPNKKTVKIVILGDKGSGKTELWCRLQRIKNTEAGGSVTKKEIKRFTLGTKNNGTEVIVEDSIDMPGGDSFVNEYDSLIKSDGTFIYYLIDVRDIKQKKNDTILRLRKVRSLIEKNRLKNCGIKILGTHIDADDENGKYSGTKDDARKEIYNELVRNGLKKLTIKNIDIISTINAIDIETIKNEIYKTLD